MTERLPARPNLEHLRTQAKKLLTQINKSDKAAVALLIKHLPAARKMTSDAVRQSKFRLADTQSVIARKAGFANWPAVVRHVSQLRDMEGVWEYVDLEVDGTKMPASLSASSRLLIDGDRFRMETPEANFEGIFTIDVEKVPNRINIEFVEGPEAGNWSYGIFELDGDHFKICLGLTGAGRPEDFVTSEGSGHALENLRRVLKTRPDGVDGGEPQPHKAPVNSDVTIDPSSFMSDTMTPALSRLQGDWVPTELIQNGLTLAESMLPWGHRTTEGNEVKVVFGGQTMVHARMRIDESKSPFAVDYLNVGRSGKGQISLGIMQWVGEEVLICMSSPGDPRPADFSCDAGSGRTLSRWRRK
jgi:uncharacterized protein (TIGR03067 family)